MNMDETAILLDLALRYVLVPLWLLAGFGDWLCHRLAHVEWTTGWRESALHWLMLVELGLVGASVWLLQINAGAMLLLVGLVALHELTSWWDLHVAARERDIPVPEQWMHSLQTVLPWVAVAGIFILHSPQTLALLGAGDEPARWALQLREPLRLTRYDTVVGLAAILMVGLPFLEELARCLRTGKNRWRVRWAP